MKEKLERLMEERERILESERREQEEKTKTLEAEIINTRERNGITRG